MTRFRSVSRFALPALGLAMALGSFTPRAGAIATGTTADESRPEVQLADIATPPPGAPRDTVARVGDQYITFSYISTMLNSSAIVGLSIPTFGTPERDQVRLTLLDKMISANLLYLDAVKNGVDKTPQYRQDMQRFSDAVLASVYKNNYVSAEIEVTQQEIQDYFDNHIAAGTEFSDEVRAGIEARLRKQKFTARMHALHDRLREGARVIINEAELDPEDDQVRDASDVIATIDGKDITWEEVRIPLSTPRNAGSRENRLEALNRLLDIRLMTLKARQAGLEQDPVYRARINEYRKTHLINIYRDDLFGQWEPDDATLRAYYTANRDRIMVNELRKVRMVVLETEQEARDVRSRIESGEITLFQAVADYSIAPDADKTLGDIGWVKKDTGFPELDRVTFALGPDEISDPVQSPAGWHLVQVTDMRDAVYDDIEDETTRQATRRRYIDEKLDAYVINLRTHEFPVEVYDDVFFKLAQQEVDWYRKVSEKTQKSPEEIIEDLRKLKK
ncbi:MAG TPA: hypothetical protein ENJ80_10190 [Gammaproteobacteria bacterium]|nr:hypothetical protein [Gammaproteobacteria bacterium]